MPRSALRGENHHPHPLVCAETRELAWSVSRRGRARLQSICRTPNFENGSTVSINDPCYSSFQTQPCYWICPYTNFPKKKKKRFNRVFKISTWVLRKLQNGRFYNTMYWSTNHHMLVKTYTTSSSHIRSQPTTIALRRLKNTHLKRSKQKCQSPWRMEHGFLTFLESVPFWQKSPAFLFKLQSK